MFERGLKLREMCWKVHCDLLNSVVSGQGMVILVCSQKACNLVCPQQRQAPSRLILLSEVVLITYHFSLCPIMYAPSTCCCADLPES